ncbi:MAG: transposase [Desulfobulbus sp.]|jgi:hypothetical protein
MFCKKPHQNKEIRAVAHHNTILRQIVAYLPRHDFNALAKAHHHGQKFRAFNRWSQFITDNTWFQTLTKNRIFFVTRLKSNARIQGLRKRPGRKAKGITADQTILLGKMSQPLRKVCYQDPETGKELSFVTNADHLDAQTIAEPDKERWQIELFFKWIKGNLKIKTFLGTSRNAVLTQIWIALSVYLLLTFLKFKARLGVSLQHMLRLLQLNLFERRNFIELFKLPDKQPVVYRQFLLFKDL